MDQAPLTYPWALHRPSDDAPRSLWRYFGGGHPVTLQEGYTPLVSAGAGIWIKDEGRNPNGTFQDRVASIVATAARQAGRGHIVCTGVDTALAASLAVYAALAGIHCSVADALTGTAHEHLLCKATTAEVIDHTAVTGPGEDLTAALRLALHSLAFEIGEQLGWQMPGRVIFPGLAPSEVEYLAEGFDLLLQKRWVPDRPLPEIAIPESAHDRAGSASTAAAEAFQRGLPLSPEGALALSTARQTDRPDHATVVVNPRSALAASDQLARLLRIHRYPRRMPVGGIITPQ